MNCTEIQLMEAYIFINRRRDKIKLLVWDRTDFVLYYKSLESGTFEFPQNHKLAISWEKLWMILEGISLQSNRYRKVLPGQIPDGI